MDFAPSLRSVELAENLRHFIDTIVIPAQASYDHAVAEHPNRQPDLVGELQNKARAAGLWNLCVRDDANGAGLPFVDYAPLAEMMGPYPLALEATNCDPPSNINADAMFLYATAEQRERWLEPQLDGRIRSAFAMTEPGVASSDAANIATSAVQKGDQWRLNGRKWYISGVLHPNCAYMMTVACTDPEAGRHGRHTQFIVPLNTPGVNVIRNLPKFGYLDPHGHVEVEFDNVCLPDDSVLGQVGGGFAIGQARLGPARVQHCMRIIGIAEEALRLMCERAQVRSTFGASVATRANVMDWIADARIDIDAARLLTLRTAG